LNTPALLTLALVPILGGSTSSETPPELGRVRFGRDVDAALLEAKAARKPVFLLFQEIPGCATCKGFGAGPLTHPLLVEAIETLFVPVAVRNNEGGDDAKALERFHEPAWNNPVVRWLDGDGHDLIPREEGVWSAAAIAARMTKALENHGATVPEWLKLARAELDVNAQRRVVLGMHCFWEGQTAIGAIPGVVDARPGFVDSFEVVDVRFAPGLIALSDLVRAAEKAGCAAQVWVSDKADLEAARAVVGEHARLLSGSVREAAASDDLRRLKESNALRQLTLTRAQSVRVNALLARADLDPKSVLSPRQVAELREIEARSMKRD
jgi:hypothetical protein